MNKLIINEDNDYTTYDKQIEQLKRIILDSNALGVITTFTDSNNEKLTLTLSVDTVEKLVDYMQEKCFNTNNNYAQLELDDVLYCKTVNIEVDNQFKCDFFNNISSADLLIIPDNINYNTECCSLVIASTDKSRLNISNIRKQLRLLYEDNSIEVYENNKTSFIDYTYLYQNELVTDSQIKDIYFNSIESTYDTYNTDNLDYDDWLDEQQNNNQLHSVIFID